MWWMKNDISSLWSFMLVAKYSKGIPSVFFSKRVIKKNVEHFYRSVNKQGHGIVFYSGQFFL